MFADLISRIKKEKPQHVTLLYAFKNKTKNNAVILQKEIIKALEDDV